MNRRVFLGKGLAALAGMIVGAKVSAEPAPRWHNHESLIEVQWVRACRNRHEDKGCAEGRFRVDGGEWQVKFAILDHEDTRFYLTEDVYVELGRLWNGPADLEGSEESARLTMLSWTEAMSDLSKKGDVLDEIGFFVGNLDFLGGVQ